jgi:hypothetical protein
MKKPQETGPLSEMWTIPSLGTAVFYRQVHIQPFFRIVRQTETKWKSGPIFRNSGPLITSG